MTPSFSPRHSASRFSWSRIGGAHLNWVAPSGTRLGLEAEVVRAGLDRERAAPRPSRARSARTEAADERWTTCTAQPVSRAERDEQRDRRVLPGGRPRAQVAGIGARITPSGRRVPEIELGVREERQPRVAQHRHRLRADRPRWRWGTRRCPSGRGTPCSRARRRRASPASSPALPGIDAAPEADVDVQLPGGRAPLRLERGAGRGDREAVERHVDQRGDAARGRRAGRGREPFPVGASRLVDVNVAVDEPRRDHPRAEVLDRDVRRHGGGRRPGDERADAPLLDEHGAGADAPVRSDDRRLRSPQRPG